MADNSDKKQSQSQKQKSTGKAVKNPHDRFFKSALEHRQAALELFDRYMPKELKAHALLDEYEMVNESFLDASLDEQVTDATFKIPMKYGDPMYLYQYQFIEHQRRVRLDMPVRELELKAKIARYHMNRYNTRKIPLVHMIVVYNGKEAYTAPRNLWEMTDAPPDLAKRIWTLPYELIDLREETLDDLTDLMWLQLVFTLLKQIDSPRILEEIIKIGYNMEIMALDIGGMELLKSAFTYLYEASEHAPPQTTAKIIRDQIGQKTGGAAMTAAELLRAEGRAEGLELGLEQGREEAAFNMFAKDFSLELVSEILKLSSEKVIALKAEWDRSQN